jgi:predicted RNA-binding Zn ribbon-like protein
MAVTETELIEGFVNTLHKHASGAEDELLASPRELGEWLRRHDLLEPGDLTEADVAPVIELRESLRTLLLANNAVDVDVRPAWAVLDDAARRGRVELRFADGAPELVAAAAGVDGAIGRIAALVQRTMADGTWPRLKACRAHDCEWAFLDNAKNQSRAWCSMRSCGNREKARAFRRRQTTSS